MLLIGIEPQQPILGLLFFLIGYNGILALVYRKKSCLDENGLGIELYWGKVVEHLALEICLDNYGEDKIHFNLSIPFLFSLHLTFNLGYSYLIALTNLRKSKPYQRKQGKGYFFEPYHGHETGFSFGKEYCRISFFHCDMDYDFNRWFSFHRGWNTEDLLYGKLDIDVVENYTSDMLGIKSPKESLTIHVPEMMNYPKAQLTVEVTYTKITHRRPRKKERFIFYRTNVKATSSSEPIYRRGKGENSWDQDDVDMANYDVSYGDYIPLNEISQKVVEDIRRDRVKYG